MALSPPPRRNKNPTEAEIEAVINKGGGVARPDANTENTDEMRHISARLPESFIREIDTFRAARPRKMGSPKLGISLRDWIIEAIQEKMERERKKFGR